MDTITLPITDQERTRIQALLTEYKDVYATHDYDCGLFKYFVILRWFTPMSGL